MPSTEARKAFDNNCEDIKRLMEIHTDYGGTGAGYRHQLEVLNKSAIVLLCAIWEAYCEDLAAEAVEHIVSHAKADGLSKSIKKIVAAELEKDPNEIAVWDLAGDGWKTVMRERLAKLQKDRNRRLNTPKAIEIQELFKQALGIDDITAKWYWAGMSVQNARNKLNKFVELRGDIAHRGKPNTTCSKDKVTDFLNHVTRLVGKTGGGVNTCVKSITKKSLW
ncbi:MAG: MAE_28990/MAE_18760 family HEPN-like nuclease [Pirellulales bacterium]